jgi:hypothetical protein
VNKQIFGLQMQNYDSILFNSCSPDERSKIRGQYTSLCLLAHALEAACGSKWSRASAPVRKMQERLWSAFFGRAAPATVPATPAD